MTLLWRGVVSLCVLLIFGVMFEPTHKLAWAVDAPSALADAEAKFYNFLVEIANGQGVTSSQRLVINSTIVPFDIAEDTPFYNEELFRQNSDRTFGGAIGSIQGSTAVFQAARFSSQYRAVLSVAAARIDQNHPEIRNSLEELFSQLSTATTKLVNKNNEIENAWIQVATARKLDPQSKDPKAVSDYYAQRVTFYAQARYADQVQTFSDDIDRINAQIQATRAKVYSPSEQAVLENVSNLSSAYNIYRPWNAQTERGYKDAGTPLTPLMLANPLVLPPSLFDSSPLVMPVGNLVAFLSASGVRAFDTSKYSSRLETGTDTWVASGSVGLFGISLGGGGSGSSSFSRSVSKLSTYDVSFKNVAEYFIDRSAWFNPGVLQDPAVLKLVGARPELNNLQYVSVSLIVARGLTLRLHFSEAVKASDWSQQSFNAQGGASFFGFSFGASGGSTKTRSTITVDTNGTTVTFQDDDKLARVLGARVEPFVTPPKIPPQGINDLVKGDAALDQAFKEFSKGQRSYLDLQKQRLDTIKKMQRSQ